MAEIEGFHARHAEPITITVLRARNLKGNKGDVVNSVVKVEFGEKTLGETPKVECTPDTPAEFNYHTKINVTFDDPSTLDELACKPILCTVTEILPKEKKKGEEKSQPLGQCTLDLMSLLEGVTKKTYTLTIHPLPGSSLIDLPPDHPQPELDVTLSVGDALLSEAQLKECNLMTLTLESLYSPPESWGVSGAGHMYTAALPMPLAAERENTLVFAGGQLVKPTMEKEPPNKQKKWAIPGNAQAGSVYITDKVLAADELEDEWGDFKAKEDREHRLTAEQDKPRVTWNIERRSYLDPAATKTFQDKIAKCRYWPVEVMRTMLPTGTKGKKDEDVIAFHGVAYVNIAPLLYPGVKRIRGAYKVHAYSDLDLQEKTNRRTGVAEEAAKIAAGIILRNNASPLSKGGKKDEGGKKDLKKGASMMKASDSVSEPEGAVVNVEGQQYVEARSYMMLEISLNRPLVPKRQPEELAQRVAEYIPPRPLFPKRTDGAERAVDDFQNQVGVVANLILDEFRDQFGESLMSGEANNTPEAMEERRQNLIYHLNANGKYFAFKEQLKYAVVKIVREKYLKTSNFKTNDELQAFLSELYVYLIDQMHVGLNNVLQIEDQTPVPEPLTDSAQLKHFAREAEVNENFELATKYYQERIARDRNEPDHWVDYGTFCLYINNLNKAEECFKECVSIDQRHITGLILYGVVCSMQDKNEAAETFFEAATSIEPKNVLVWTMLGLFYDGIGNEIGAEMALLEANKLNQASAVAAAKALKQEQQAQAKEAQPDPEKDDVQADIPPESPADVPSETKPSKDGAIVTGADPAIPAVKLQGTSPASMAGSEGKQSRTAPKERRSSAMRKSAGGKLKTSADNISRGGTPRSPAGGYITEERHDDTTAQPPRDPTPVPTQTIFMHVVDFLLEVKAMPFTERTLSHHLLDSLGGPSAEYHIALARLKLQKRALEEADENLKVALQMDHQNPDAWALLGHVTYLLGDTETAKDCYERTMAFIADASEMHSIYLRLASIYLHESKFQDAKNTFLLSCKKTPSCVSWLGVGIACYRLEELSEAEDALSEANILNNTDPEVWAYLSLVCLKTGRQLEAEQAYKYAIKLDLNDEVLLRELHELQEEQGFGNPQL